MSKSYLLQGQWHLHCAEKPRVAQFPAEAVEKEVQDELVLEVEVDCDLRLPAARDDFQRQIVTQEEDLIALRQNRMAVIENRLVVDKNAAFGLRFHRVEVLRLPPGGRQLLINQLERLVFALALRHYFISLP